MGSDPRREARTRGGRGRMEREPGWADALLAGRSHADREADQDFLLRGMLLVAAVLTLALEGLHALFAALGLQLGWWSAPVFAPPLVWLLVSAGMRRVLRPVELDSLRWRQRLYGAGMLAVTLWACWPLWAGPAAGAWKAAHGGFGPLGPRYPLGAVLGASPVAMGLVAVLLLALGMVLAPNIRQREREWPAPPAGPEPLRAPLVSQQRPSPQRPRPPRWP
jgi:hypothetical protein